jgi:hypothetical protein
MRSRALSVALAVGAVVVLVVLFVVLREDETDEPSTTAPPPAARETGPDEAGRRRGRREARPPVREIVVRGGRPVGGVQRLSLEKGERVRFVVRSDVADEVHVHGYDLRKDVAAGGSARFSFPASIEGVFEIELEQRHEQLASLSVEPS